MLSLSETLTHVAPRHDKYDLLLGAMLSGLALGAIILSSVFEVVTLRQGLVVIATVSAFAAIYQLRHSNATPPAVRQDFDNCDDGDSCDFGLRNFGPGPALYIQLIAKLEGEPVVELKPHQRPVHLPEGDFLGLLHDERLKLDNRLEIPEATNLDVELYYSYLSVDGVREPPALDDQKKDAGFYKAELTADDRTPRTMALDRIRENCT